MAIDQSSARAFNAALKQAIQKEVGFKVSVSIVNSYKFPNCWVQVTARPNLFSNTFRLKVFDCCGFDRKGLLNDTDVSYGNIQKNYISANVNQWQKVFNDEH